MAASRCSRSPQCTPVALDAIALIAKAMPDAMVGAGTVLNCAQFDAAVAAGARFVISPGADPGPAGPRGQEHGAADPGVATPSEVMQALEGATTTSNSSRPRRTAAPRHSPPSRRPAPGEILPHRRHRPENVADYLALKCVATVGGSWMLPADAVKSGNWER